MKVKLPILFNKETDNTLIELGVKSEEECIPETRDMIFLNIDALSPYFYNDNEFTCIHTSNQNFICPMLMNEVLNSFEKTDVGGEN